MRYLFFSVLLTCIVFSASAKEFTCRRLYLRRALTAATIEDAPTTFFFAKPLASDPFAFQERRPFALPLTTETAASTTHRTAEKERPSVADRGRSESRSLRQDDGRDDNLTSEEGPLLSSRTPA